MTVMSPTTDCLTEMQSSSVNRRLVDHGKVLSQMTTRVEACSAAVGKIADDLMGPCPDAAPEPGSQPANGRLGEIENASGFHDHALARLEENIKRLCRD